MESIIAGAVLVVLLLIGVDVSLNIKDRISRSIARKRMEKVLCKRLHELESVLKAQFEQVEQSPEEARKAKNRAKTAAYRAKKRAAKKTK